MLNTRVMGVETEYAMSLPGEPVGSERWGGIMDAMLNRIGARSSALRGALCGGLFLGNGSRFYFDAGAHPEFCTPETAHPDDCVRYILAGERLLSDALAERPPAINGHGGPLLF